jgi:DNA polymerase III delta subunit
VKRFHLIQGRKDASAGERHDMVERAHRILAAADVSSIARFDIPGRSSGEQAEESGLRAEVERLVPTLQSGSLFGGIVGVVVADAQNLLKHEGEVLADLLATLDPGEVAVVLVSIGAAPTPISRLAKAEGEVHSVKALTERDMTARLGEMARERRMRLEPAAATALLQRFGIDVGALAGALDQLVAVSGPITAEEVVGRFKNRPDEPAYLFVDALSSGDVGAALRRLSAFLTHGHPLVLLAAVEADLKRKALASAAGSLAEFAGWAGGGPDYYPNKKAWQARSSVSEDDLHRALHALARADITLKTEPEVTHRPTLERLTVALARWYG